MIVVVVEPNKKPYIKDISNTLEAMQEIVNGHLETVPVYIGDKMFVGVCNGEGKSSKLELNRVMSGMAIHGTFIIVDYKDFNFKGLKDEDLEFILSNF